MVVSIVRRRRVLRLSLLFERTLYSFGVISFSCLKGAVIRIMRNKTITAIAWTGLTMLLIGITSPLKQGVLFGPENGSLVIVGGGRVGDEIIEKFIELAGGPDIPIVIVPTAGGRDTYTQDDRSRGMFERAGATDLTILHTYDPQEADTEEFVRPLLRAGGVWFPGGRQWRLTDAYLGTRTYEEFHNVLARGGVIGGSSAGASIQASYMVRGAPEGNRIMMAEGHEIGFSFLRNSAVDQHINTRQREKDLKEVLDRYPELLGIGLYESTAVVVQGDMFEVIGAGNVAINDSFRRPSEGEEFYYLLSPGERFDLRKRELIPRRPPR
jgi:cyanophycinase